MHEPFGEHLAPGTLPEDLPVFDAERVGNFGHHIVQQVGDQHHDPSFLDQL